MLQARGPLRVCHLGKYYPPAPGGIEMHVRTLARAQAQMGADVRVICINHADRRGRDVTWRRYGATPTIIEADGGVVVGRIGRSAAFARLDICPALARVIRRLREQPPHVLHLHTPNPTMVLAAASLLRRDVTLVVSHHSDIVRQRAVLRWLHGPLERAVYARAAAVLASSPQYIAHSALLRRHESKVHVVPMGIDLAPLLHPAPAALAWAQRLRRRFGGILWLAVGRCVYYKGLSVAIEALAKVPGVLLIVGRGPLVHELRAQARRLGVGDRVAWCSYAQPHELAGAYLAARALWFPSNARSEAFGLVQVEAMAAGCPVINAHIPGSGVPWVSQHESSALTVAVNDASALAQAAGRLLAEPSLRARLIAGGLRRARELFDHRTMAQRCLEIYHEALHARGRHIAPAGAAGQEADARRWMTEKHVQSDRPGSSIIVPGTSRGGASTASGAVGKGRAS